MRGGRCSRLLPLEAPHLDRLWGSRDHTLRVGRTRGGTDRETGIPKEHRLSFRNEVESSGAHIRIDLAHITPRVRQAISHRIYIHRPRRNAGS